MAGNDPNNTASFLEFVFGFYKTMKANEIKLVYEGKITHQITKAFISIFESRMELDREEARLQRIIFHVMVESLQNISRHADDHESPEIAFSGKGIFMVSKNSEIYRITTGNAILNEKIPLLKNMIDQVNNLDKSELKDFYIKQMKEGRLSEKGGAGLGFIDIRRKTGTKLEYHFLPLSDKNSFFLLTTIIPRTS